MFGVQFNIGASRQAIARALAALRDPTPMFQDITEYLIDQRRQRFVKGVGPDGTAWAAKKQSTLERYKALGYGSLPKPLVGPGKRLSREIVGTASKNGSVVGSALIYSGVMNDGAAKGAFGRTKRGGPIPWGRIPARPWIDLGRDEGAAIVEIAEEHIAEALGGD